MLRSIVDSFSQNKYVYEKAATGNVATAEALLDKIPNTEATFPVTNLLISFISMGRGDEARQSSVSMPLALVDICSQWATYMRYIDPSSEDAKEAAHLDEEAFDQLVEKPYFDSIPPE